MTAEVYNLDYSRDEGLGWVRWSRYKASADEALVVHRESAATK